MASYGSKLHEAENRSSTIQRRRRRPFGAALRRTSASPWFAAAAVVIAMVPAQTLPAHAEAQQATSPSMICPDDGQELLRMPEIVSSGGILTGTILLTDEQQRLQVSQRGGTSKRCAPQWLRVFRAAGADSSPKFKPETSYLDPMPGPTLRARVGEIVQLTLLNQINSNHYDPNIDREECIRVNRSNAELYPGATKDVYANCLHASSTANIHFHGTHTNPNSTGDNVFLQIRPLPRDNAGNLAIAPGIVTAYLDEFFKKCTENLTNPLNAWPFLWGDLPKSWTDKQMELLLAYDRGIPPYKPPAKSLAQQLWPPNQDQIDKGQWPQYYVGAYPYCFALPAYTAATYPPPAGMPLMGQAPGIHWYHAHKHGSTAINVAGGMTGAFIIEGKYDDDLNAGYAKYVMKDGKDWNTRSQPVIVLNQLSSDPNLLGGISNVDFSVNGRVRPKIQMQPGEIQLWRIVNTSGRSAVYFQAPEGFEWMQLAQDGVQFADVNYQNSRNRPIFTASGNRVDLLVKAPKTGSAKVLIQNVIARADVKPTPVTPTATDPNPGTLLMTIEVAGPPVLYEGMPAEMPFLRRAPTPPKFLENINDAELKKVNYPTKRLAFNSKNQNMAAQHTINDLQFENGHINVSVQLNTVEEWTLVNTTNSATGPGNIDHPFHIHVNPFQVTELFDPNEQLVDPKTGKLETVLDDKGKTQSVARYVTNEADFSKVDEIKRRQCFLDPKNNATWKPCSGATYRPDLVWWDVFAIPSARVPTDANSDPLTNSKGEPIVIPGYFKMRSRFVDYAGYYVLHCHILTHEDRGMMFIVQVMKPSGASPRHH